MQTPTLPLHLSMSLEARPVTGCRPAVPWLCDLGLRCPLAKRRRRVLPEGPPGCSATSATRACGLSEGGRAQAGPAAGGPKADGLPAAPGRLSLGPRLRLVSTDVPPRSPPGAAARPSAAPAGRPVGPGAEALTPPDQQERPEPHLPGRERAAHKGAHGPGPCSLPLIRTPLFPPELGKLTLGKADCYLGVRSTLYFLLCVFLYFLNFPL